MPERSKTGLVKKKITVKRNGKTYERYQWVKAGEDESEPKKDKKVEPTKKGSYAIGDKVFYGGKNREIIKVSESQKTVKLDNNQVYTFDAINKIKSIKKSEPKKESKIKDLKREKITTEKPKIISINKSKKNMESHISELNKTFDGKDLLNRIESYTGGDYKSFNEYLRTGKMSIRDIKGKIKVGKPTKTKKEQRDNQINKISNFLKDAPKVQGTVYRGMMWKDDKKSIKEFNEFINKFIIGNNIKFPTFSSTSTDKNTAIEFATSKDAKNSIVFNMKSKNGVYLNGTSAFKDENEVLFNKDSKFAVVNIDKNSDPIKISLREI